MSKSNSIILPLQDTRFLQYSALGSHSSLSYLAQGDFCIGFPHILLIRHVHMIPYLSTEISTPSHSRNEEEEVGDAFIPLCKIAHPSSLTRMIFVPLPPRLSLRWTTPVCPGAGAKVPPPSKTTLPTSACHPWWAKVGNGPELSPFPAVPSSASDQKPGRCRGLKAKGRQGMRWSHWDKPPGLECNSAHRSLP